MDDKLNDQWQKFLQGRWQLDMPQRSGRYPMCPRNGEGGSWGTNVVYLHPVKGVCMCVHAWGGFWWSEPLPDLPVPAESTEQLLDGEHRFDVSIVPLDNDGVLVSTEQVTYVQHAIDEAGNLVQRPIPRCDECGGSGEVPTGYCHCGEPATGVSCDNHAPVEMIERCEECRGTGSILPDRWTDRQNQ